MNSRVNYKKLTRLLLPVRLRKPVFGSVLNAAVTPVVCLYREALEHRTAAFKRLEENGQVCRLTAALNDRYDTARRRIRIEDTVPEQGYLQVSKRTLGYLPTARRDAGYLAVAHRGYDTATPDFIVNIPASLYSKQNNIERTVRALRLAGKTFKINTIND